MIRLGRCVLIVSTMMAFFMVTAASGATSKSSTNPVLGIWSLVPAESKFEGVPPLKSQTRTYEDWGCGILHVKFESEDASGKKTYTEFAARSDGRDYPRVVRGSATAGTIALKRVNNRTVTFTQKEDGKVTISGTRAVSADGKRDTVKYSGTNTEGKPVSGVLVFEKQ